MLHSKTISRRDALRVGVAAGAVAVLPAGNTAASADVDPIFAAIDEHKAAEARFNVALDAESAVEDELSGLDDYETNSRWIAAHRARYDADDAVDPFVLVKTRPTTLAGACALLKYLADYELAGNQWPNGYNGDDSWSPAIHRSLAQALAEIAGRVA